jgi:hypothetical protein
VKQQLHHGKAAGLQMHLCSVCMYRCCLMLECRHSCQYKGATIKGNRFCLVMKHYSKSLARAVAEAGSGELRQRNHLHIINVCRGFEK